MGLIPPSLWKAEGKLTDFAVEERPIRDCEFVEIDPGCRVYYRPAVRAGGEEGKIGFYWTAVEWCSGSGEWPRTAPMLDDPDCEALHTCHGVALWDGLRHIYWGDNGYLYYPVCSRLGPIILTLAALELRFCREPSVP